MSDDYVPVDAMASAPAPWPVLSRSTQLLPVALTDRQRSERGQEMAAVHREMATHQAHAESIKSELKATAARLSARLSELAEVVCRGNEMREVQIEVLADYERGQAMTVRMDTGAEIDRRILRPTERQQTLPIYTDDEDDGTDQDDESLLDQIDPDTSEIPGEILAAAVDEVVTAADATRRASRRGKRTLPAGVEVSGDQDPRPPDER